MNRIIGSSIVKIRELHGFGFGIILDISSQGSSFGQKRWTLRWKNAASTRLIMTSYKKVTYQIILTFIFRSKRRNSRNRPIPISSGDLPWEIRSHSPTRRGLRNADLIQPFGNQHGSVDHLQIHFALRVSERTFELWSEVWPVFAIRKTRLAFLYGTQRWCKI